MILNAISVCGAIAFVGALIWSMEITLDLDNWFTNLGGALFILFLVPVVIFVPFLTNWPWWAYPLFWIGSPVGVFVFCAFVIAELESIYGRE